MDVTERNDDGIDPIMHERTNERTNERTTNARSFDRSDARTMNAIERTVFLGGAGPLPPNPLPPPAGRFTITARTFNRPPSPLRPRPPRPPPAGLLSRTRSSNDMPRPFGPTSVVIASAVTASTGYCAASTTPSMVSGSMSRGARGLGMAGGGERIAMEINRAVTVRLSRENCSIKSTRLRRRRLVRLLRYDFVTTTKTTQAITRCRTRPAARTSPDPAPPADPRVASCSDACTPSL